jgi:hypothetical protein
MTTLTLTYPLTADDLALLAALGVGGPGAGPGTGPGGVVNYFPSDPGTAPFPSPENSQMLVEIAADGTTTIGGAPYLKDLNGAEHQLQIVNGAVQYVLNSVVGGVASGYTPGQLLVRQGTVYMQLNPGGIWQLNGYNATLPPAWTTAPGGGSTGLPPLPALPTPSAVAPGSSGNIINCGSGQALATLSAAIPTAVAGDTIQLAAGTYTDTPPSWSVPLLIDLGGATFNADGQTATLAHGKGLLVPAADSIIQNGTVTGVAMDQGSGQLTSAVRPEVGCGYLTLKNLQLHGNQCGVGEGGTGCVMELDGCDISNNGLTVNSGSLTHNLYVQCRRLTLVNVVSNGAVEAHAIKYRGPEMIVTGGTFGSSPGKPFDLPNGSTVPFQITNASIVKAATAADHGVLAYGEEGATNGLAGGFITGGTITAACPNPTITTAGGTIAVTATITGGPITATGGGTVSGI